MNVYVVYNIDGKIIDIFNDKDSAEFVSMSINGTFKEFVVRDLKREQKLKKQENCSHTMVGNGERMECTKCGYVKITTYYY